LRRGGKAGPRSADDQTERGEREEVAPRQAAA
jgi:hypothetical protein